MASLRSGNIGISPFNFVPNIIFFSARRLLIVESFNDILLIQYNFFFRCRRLRDYLRDVNFVNNIIVEFLICTWLT